MWLAKIRSTNTGIWKYDWQRWEMQLEKWLAKMKNISAGKTGEREKQGFALSLKSEIFYNNGTSRFCEWLLQNRSIAAIVQQLSNKCVLRWPVFLYNSQHTRSHRVNTHQIPNSAFLSSCCVGWNPSRSKNILWVWCWYKVPWLAWTRICWSHYLLMSMQLQSRQIHFTIWRNIFGQILISWRTDKKVLITLPADIDAL